MVTKNMKIKMATGKNLSPQTRDTNYWKEQDFIRCLLAEGWKGHENHPILLTHLHRKEQEVAAPFADKNTAKEGVAALIMDVADLSTVVNMGWEIRKKCQRKEFYLKTLQCSLSLRGNGHVFASPW